MKHRVGKKLGDTLVEVTIAIGIFSMVAVAVVSVVSSSMSGAQTALETTVAREEIDAQAEALRFIQNANLKSVWEAIEKRAVKLGDENLSYDPATCSELYQDNGAKLNSQKAFVINTRELRSGDADKIVKSFDSNVFKQATTYPRIIYQNDGNTLYDQNTSTTISRVDGIYIVAIKNAENTNIVDGTGGGAKLTSAFFDFYIRTCWYGSGSAAPTTISTVVRLYNPNVAVDDGTARVDTYGDIIIFNRNGNTDVDKDVSDKGDMNNKTYSDGTKYGQKIDTGHTAKLNINSYNSYYYEFNFWCDVKPKSPTSTSCDNGGKKYNDNQDYTAPGQYASDRKVNLYATWKQRNLVKVGANGNSGTCNSWKQQIPATMSAKLKVNSFSCTRKHYDLEGLTKKKDGSGTVYKQDNLYTVGTSDETLYAKWKEKDHNNIGFDCNGGTAVTDNLAQWVYSDDGTVNLKKVSTLCNAPSNKTFVRWNVSNCSALPSSYTDGASYKYDSSCTKGVKLTAEWKQNLPDTLTIAEGGMNTDGNCNGIWTRIKDSNYIEGDEDDLFANAQIWCGDGGCPATEKTENASFTIKYGSYTKATIETMREFDFSACPTSGWAKFGSDTWYRNYRDGTWDDGKQYWCDPYQDDTGTKTYYNQTAKTFKLSAHVGIGGTKAHYSKACVVVKKITLSGLKQ